MNQTLRTRFPARIAYFTASLEVGGSERQLVALNAGLAGEPCERHIICLSGFGPLEDEARATGAVLHDLKYPRLGGAGTFSWRSMPSALRALWRLVRILRAINPDV